MFSDKLVSIIMPTYNAESYIEAAIESVINQTHQNWELLIVDNLSTDRTSFLLKKYQSNERIKLLYEPQKGVGFARNKALASMRGDFFCFLDSDDIMPINGLESRLKIFDENLELSFVDGVVEYVDENLLPLQRRYKPDFHGEPFPLLIRLDERCLFGPSWMIKRNQEEQYKFQVDMTHAEDLYFYLSISKGKQYSYTTETILNYRQRKDSAMKSLKGLERGYALLLTKLKRDFPDEKTTFLKLRIIRIMFLSWLIDGKNPIRASLVVIKFLLL